MQSADPAPRETVGSLLRMTRAKHGVDLPHVANALRIRLAFLQAIEDGRNQDLPGPTYAVGFVRAYAEYLNLDGEEIVRRYKAETSIVPRKADLEFPTPVSEGGIPTGAMLLIAALLGAGIYGGWYWMSSEDRTVAELIQEVPDRFNDLLAAAPEAGEEGAAVVEALADTADRMLTGEEAAPTADPAPAASTTAADTPAPAVEPAPVVEPPPTEVPTVEPPPVVTEAEPAQDEPETAANEPPPAAPAAPEAPNVSPGSVERVPEERQVAVAPSSEPTVPPPPAVEEETPAAPTPAPTPAAEAEPEPAPAPEPEPEPEVAEAPEPEPEAVAEAPAAVEEPEPAPEAPQLAAVPAAPDLPEPVALNGAVYGAPAGSTRVVLAATQDSWIQVRAGDELIATRLLREGERFQVPDRRGMTLMVGNAGGLRIVVDGQTLPPLGNQGEVRRGIQLAPDSLLSN